MFYLFLYSAIIVILLKILSPLIFAIKLRIKLGEKIKIQYFPLLGLIYYLEMGVKKHNDAIHYKKSSLYDNHNLEVLIVYIKVIVSNILFTPLLIVIDPVLAKEILLNVENYKKSGTEIFNDILGAKGILYTEG